MSKKAGQHWILLRGLARESGHWGDFIPVLQSKFPEAQLTLLNLPGTGEFNGETGPRSIEAITEQARLGALAKGYLQKPVMLLALSLGGMVAWQWMQRYPDDICGCVLINTSFANLSPFYQRLRWQSYPGFIALLLMRDLHKRESAIIQLVSNQPAINPQLIKDWENLQKQRPISIKTCLNQILAAATFKPNGQKPRQPVLLLSGKGDRLVAPACSEAIQQKWDLPLYQHPQAGHDLTLDDGEWVVSQLYNWVSHL
ncbi:MAG: alpha/beta hydrolase [Methylococcaceae bacterium]|nr:alpha/beta hydrolase [Methylococcaceae bacterium]